MAVGLVAATIVLRRRIRVSFDVEAFWKCLVSSAVMAAVVLFAQAYYDSKYLLPAYVALGGLVYFAMLLLLRAVKPQDVQLLREYLGSRFRFIVKPLEWLVTGSGN